MASNEKVTKGNVSSINSFLSSNIHFRTSFLLANHALEAIFPRFPAFSAVLLKILELCSIYVKYARDFKNMLAYSLEKNYALELQIMLIFEKKHKICSTWQPCLALTYYCCSCTLTDDEFCVAICRDLKEKKGEHHPKELLAQCYIGRLHSTQNTLFRHHGAHTDE